MTLAHWTEDFYAAFDAREPRSYGMLADDIRVQVGNAPPTEGKGNVLRGPLGLVNESTFGMRHEFVNVWDMPNETTVLEGFVTYFRNDGRDVRLPVTTIAQRNGQGLVSDLRLYIDLADLFEGLSAKVAVSGSVPVNPSGSEQAITRSQLWESLVDKARNAQRFVPQITECTVIDEGVDAEGRTWILRNVILEGRFVQERVVFYPEERIVFTRTSPPQLGTVENLIEEKNGELHVAFVFDLDWHGLPGGSAFVDNFTAQVAEGYRATFQKVCDNLRSQAPVAA